MNFFNLYNRIRTRYNIVWSFSGIYFAFLSTFKKTPRNIDFLFLCHDVHRHTIKNGKLYAPLIDPIIEELSTDFQCITLATPFSKYFGNNCFGDVRIHNSIVLTAIIKRVFFQRSLSLSNITNDPLITAYKKMLHIINPKIVIGIQPSVEFCIAAKELGIKTYDMQHGLISDVNYYSLSKRKAFSQNGWPSFVLCWDQESADRVTRITEGNVLPHIIGNPSYHSQFGNLLHKESKSMISKKNDLKIEILVTLTYLDYGQSNLDECYREVGIPTEVINLINDTPWIFWRLRLHPVQVRFHMDRIDGFLNNKFITSSNVDWTTYSEVSMGAALSGCHGHITVESASALDAAQNKISTILIGCAGVSDKNKANLYFKEYIDSGMMMFEDSSNFSLKSLDFFTKPSTENLNNKNRYERLNGNQEFKNFIKDIKSL